MSKDIKLSLYGPDHLTLRDPKDQNSDLESKYNISLFDLSYFLAIALNEEFLPPYHKKRYFGTWEELKKSKRILKRTKEKLPKKPFFKRLVLMIDEYLQDIEKGLKVTRRPSGSPINKRTKVVLLWTYLLRKGKEISEDFPSREGKNRFTDEIQAVKKTVNWKDFYTLLNWFYLKLKNCSYSSYLEPKPDEQKERDYAKSLLGKHFDSSDRTKHWYDAENSIWLFKKLQEYLKPEGKNLSKQTKELKSRNIKPYPIIQVNFNKDSIEVGELRKNEIAVKKFSGIEKQKVLHVKKYNKNKPAKGDPTVIFPNGDIFTTVNYMPPFCRLDESKFDKWWEAIKPNSK